MKRRYWWFGLGALALAPIADAASLDATQVRELQSLAPGEQLAISRIDLGAKHVADVVMKRIELYAPGARIYVADRSGMREVARNDWSHFVSASGTQRFALSLAPDGREATGILLAADGRTYSVRGVADKHGLALESFDAVEKSGRSIAPYTCSETPAITPDSWQELSSDVQASAGVFEKAANRRAVVAVDTDNEIFASKFGESTSAATSYLASLFVGMNLIYERDLDLTLLQGTTILRPSSQPDPYTTAAGGSMGDQLDELGEVWVATQSGIARAFVMQISGKQLDPNSPGGPFGAEGRAWNLSSPGINYCTATNLSGGNSCSDGACTAGHYSVSRIFKPMFFTAADDLSLVAHEIGHNFGVSHTHCTDATSGAANVGTNTIDRCYASESTLGCYAGPTSCPTAATVNGVANVRGTLMSYCDYGEAPGCATSDVFADRNRSTLLPKVANNVALGCFTAGAAGGFDPIFLHGYENP